MYCLLRPPPSPLPLLGIPNDILELRTAQRHLFARAAQDGEEFVRSLRCPRWRYAEQIPLAWLQFSCIQMADVAF